MTQRLKAFDKIRHYANRNPYVNAWSDILSRSSQAEAEAAMERGFAKLKELDQRVRKDMAESSAARAMLSACLASGVE